MSAPVPSINVRPLTAIGRLATGTYTVTRSAAGSYDSNGRAVAGGTSTFTMPACVQPLTGRDLLRLPEAMRTTQLIKLYTNVKLQTATAPNGPIPDVIAYSDGFNYQVQTVLDWSEAGGYGKYVAQKVGQ